MQYAMTFTVMYLITFVAGLLYVIIRHGIFKLISIIDPHDPYREGCLYTITDISLMVSFIVVIGMFLGNNYS